MADIDHHSTNDGPMTYPVFPGEDRRPAELFVLLDAARCWCRARQHHQSTQPALFASLERFPCEQLAPVIDSLMTLGELVLSHPFRIGTASRLSEDENRLLDMYEGRRCAIMFECSGALAHAFSSALLSVRVMMVHELNKAPKGTAPSALGDRYFWNTVLSAPADKPDLRACH